MTCGEEGQASRSRPLCAPPPPALVPSRCYPSGRAPHSAAGPFLGRVPEPRGQNCEGQPRHRRGAELTSSTVRASEVPRVGLAGTEKRRAWALGPRRVGRKQKPGRGARRPAGLRHSPARREDRRARRPRWAGDRRAGDWDPGAARFRRESQALRPPLRAAPPRPAPTAPPLPCRRPPLLPRGVSVGAAAAAPRDPNRPGRRGSEGKATRAHGTGHPALSPGQRKRQEPAGAWWGPE